MTRPRHPKERPAVTRRAFLRKAAAAGAALPAASVLLAACTGGGQSAVGTAVPQRLGSGGLSGAPYPLARPDAPVTWSVDRSQVIPSNQQPEQNATVRMLRWPYYLAPSVIRSFEDAYHCRVIQTEFPDMQKGLDALTAGQGEFDVMIGMNVWALGKSIASGLIRPLNLDYIPNLAANTWDTFQSPFYDVGSHYSTPYSVWSTGIFWRSDHVKQDIAAMANPYDIFWNGAPVNRTHLLSDAQDVLAMAMFRDGISDVNSADAATVSQAKNELQEVVAATNVSFDHADYVDIPAGSAWLHQSWSGNVCDAFVFLKANQASVADSLSYIWPVEVGVPGNVDNDLLVVLNSGKNPVLSHLLVNHILDAKNAMTNFATWTGYQMPQKTMTREALVGTGLVPERLANVYIVEGDMDRGSRELELAPADQALWDAAYHDLKTAV